MTNSILKSTSMLGGDEAAGVGFRQPKERPILFQGAMVRAILAGTKTQTRRAVKLPHMNPLGRWEPMDVGGPNGGRTAKGEAIPAQQSIWHTRTGDSLLCPYGAPGERLWVRETARCVGQSTDFIKKNIRFDVDYKAAGGTSFNFALDEAPHWFPRNSMNVDCSPRWQPAIHMPRWASRITLEITGVRVERLQDISEEDAIAEGGERREDIPHCPWWHGRHGPVGPCMYTCARDSYRYLWDSINGAGSWDTNPWVWVVEFRRC